MSVTDVVIIGLTYFLGYTSLKIVFFIILFKKKEVVIVISYKINDTVKNEEMSEVGNQSEARDL